MTRFGSTGGIRPPEAQPADNAAAAPSGPAALPVKRLKRRAGA